MAKQKDVARLYVSMPRELAVKLRIEAARREMRIGRYISAVLAGTLDRQPAAGAK